MKTDNASSDSGSAEASETKPPPPSAPAERLSESDYLAQQAHNAQLAMSQAWREVKVRLGQGADPRAWAGEYPWITVSAAAVAGFVAASALIPSKEQQALRKLAAIERALHPPPPEHPEHGNGDQKKPGPGILGTVIRELIGLARPLLTTLISANLGGIPMPPDGQTAQPQDAASQP